LIQPTTTEACRARCPVCYESALCSVNAQPQVYTQQKRAPQSIQEGPPAQITVFYHAIDPPRPSEEIGIDRRTGHRHQHPFHIDNETCPSTSPSIASGGTSGFLVAGLPPLVCRARTNLVLFMEGSRPPPAPYPRPPTPSPLTPATPPLLDFCSRHCPNEFFSFFCTSRLFPPRVFGKTGLVFFYL